jgi:hypothetical protein
VDDLFVIVIPIRHKNYWDAARELERFARDKRAKDPEGALTRCMMPENIDDLIGKVADIIKQ